MNILLNFLVLISHRALSGFQNGAGYSLRKIVFSLKVTNLLLIISSSLLVIFPFVWLWVNIENLNYNLFILIPLAIVSSFCSFSIYSNFKRLLTWIPNDIHLYETFLTPSFLFISVFLGYNLIDIFFSVYPGLVLHKGFVNVGSGLPFIDRQERTDDATGNTYNIPSLGIKIPRNNKGFQKLLFAVLSLVLFTLNFFYFKVILSVPLF